MASSTIRNQQVFGSNPSGGLKRMGILMTPSACSCALKRRGTSIRRMSATTLKSGGWRPLSIASTIFGDKNPSGMSRRTDRRSRPSRLTISSADRTWPEMSSPDHLRARATALSNGRSILPGLRSPSSTSRNSIPRRFIRIGTNLVRPRWFSFALFRSLVARSASLSATWMPSRLSATRPTNPASGDEASFFVHRRSIQLWVDLRMDGSRSASISAFSQALAISLRSASIFCTAKDTDLSISGADSRHPYSASWGKGAIGRFCKVSHRASDIGGVLATRYLKADGRGERVRQRRVGHDVEEPISVDVLRYDLVLRWGINRKRFDPLPSVFAR